MISLSRAAPGPAPHLGSPWHWAQQLPVPAKPQLESPTGPCVGSAAVPRLLQPLRTATFNPAAFLGHQALPACSLELLLLSAALQGAPDPQVKSEPSELAGLYYQVLDTEKITYHKTQETNPLK